MLPESLADYSIDNESELSHSLHMPAFSNHIKMVLVGDKAVGKSSLITNYLENRFDDEYVPKVLDVH